MKTLADFKRRLTVGTKIHTVWHQKGIGRDENGVIILGDEDKGIRTVSIVQSNSFALKTIKGGKEVDSWCSYPKSSEIEILNENSVLIYSPDFRERDKEVLIPCLTYTFV